MKEKFRSIVMCVVMIVMFFTVAVPMNVSAQNEDIALEWVERYDGLGNAGDRALGMAIDALGNIYVTGISYSGFATYVDILTISYDPLGNIRWSETYSSGGSNSNDWARSIAIGPSGNVYLAGHFGTRFVIPSPNYAILSYDSSGNFRWVREYNGPANGRDIALDIAVDPITENIYVTGQSPGIDTELDYATVAYDLLGNPLWDFGGGEIAARYSGPDNVDDRSYDVEIDPLTGDVYVTGISDRGKTAEYTTGDYATIKYDKNTGQPLWDFGGGEVAARYNGPADGTDGAYAMTIGASGTIYVTGSSRGINTYFDYATIAYDSSGTQKWEARTTGYGSDAAQDIVVDSEENVYVTGWCNGPAMDYGTVGYDSLGNELWMTTYHGGYGTDVAWAIALGTSGNVYVTGFSQNGTYGFDRNYATVAYDSITGDEEWVERYNGPGWGVDTAYAIATDSLGNIYVTGESAGIGSMSDFATIKYSPLKPPVADAGPDQTVNEGDDVLFDGTGSYDPDGVITSFDWDFGDGGIGTGPTPTHAYGDNDVYTVTLTVTDNDGYQDTDTCIITVNNVDPTAIINGPYFGYENQPITFNGDVFDPGWLDTHTFEWDLNDDGIFETTGQNPTFTWNDDYSGTIWLKVTDDDGGIGIASTTVTVYNLDPEGVGNVSIEPVDEAGKGYIEVYLDVSGATPTWLYVYFLEVDGDEPFDDPTTLVRDVEGNVIRLSNDGDSAVFLYDSQYTYWKLIFINVDENEPQGTTIKIRYTHVIGGVADPNYGQAWDKPIKYTEDTVFDLYNVTEYVVGLHYPPGQVSYAYLFDVTISDPGSDDLTFVWDFGDGDTDTATYYNDGVGPDPYPSPYTGTAPFLVNHVVNHLYDKKGTYTATLTVTDDDGGIFSYTTEIIVE